MKKFILFLLFMASSLTVLIARPVDLQTTVLAATKFASMQFSLQRGETPKLAYTGRYDAFYVFNIGPNGFVIISSDDAFRPVIGYSNESSFDATDIPPALQDYLDGIAESIHRLGNNAVATPMVAAEWKRVLNNGQLLSRQGGKGVDFLCQTKWNQDYPYNYCCPEDPAGSGGHTYVGCLATAMSQLMRFWAYPIQGSGNHCYHHDDYGEICADFGSTTYDWDNMPNVLNSNSSEAEKLATGTLCFHCGVTIDMGYGPDGSGGGSSPIVNAMPTYFNYCDNIQFLRRNDYELEEWKTMVREQFDMGWPMYYGGCEDDGCHAFVCDGYDDHDMFHFNLGWGGGSDGWYIIDDAPYTHPADAMFNFVPAEVYNQTPMAPAGFSAVAVSDTELKATLHWTNPTATLDGTPLSSIERVVVLRNNQVIATIDGATPGANVEIIDDAIPCYDLYHYAVYVEAGGRHGKHANVTNVQIGPSCTWKIIMTTNSFQGWRGGGITIYNNTGHKIAHATMTSSTTISIEPSIPLGRISFGWTAPEETVNSIGFVIKDAENNTVYSFQGSSDQMAAGIFFETNNSCGGALDCGTPENLTATTMEDGIMLTWDAVENHGYGYNLYRDDLLYRLIQDNEMFFDEQPSLGGHCYRVTVLCDGGETGLYSNESCITFGPCYPPRDLDYEFTSNFKVKLKWDAPSPSEGLTGYYLFRKKDDEAYRRIKNLGPNAVTFTDNGLNTEGDYYYRLYAYYGDLDCTSAPANRKYHSDVFEVHAYYSPTGIAEDDGQVKVYPNPTKGQVRVEAPNMHRIELYNTLGKCVFEKDIEEDQVTLDLQDYGSGLYLLRVTTDNGEMNRRIAVTH